MNPLERSPYESILPPTESIPPQMSFISGPEAPMVSDMLKTLHTSMPQSRKKLTFEEEARAGKHRLDQMDPARVGKHLVMFQPTEQGVADVLALARLSIPAIAETEEVLLADRISNFDVGAEVIHARRVVTGGDAGNLNRLQFSVQYSFQ